MVKLIKTQLTKNSNRIQLLEAESCFCYEKARTVLFIGVFHGDEPEGEFLINNLIDEIQNNFESYKQVKTLFIPVLNPDGKALNTRVNANGVDLNRNFPTENWELSAIKDAYYSGDAPASEIETQFLMSIIEEFKPDLIMSLHTPYKIVNFDGPAEKIALHISKCTEYPIQDYIGYPTPGSFGTYAGIERNIPVITLELPENTEEEVLWAQNKQAFIDVASGEIS